MSKAYFKPQKYILGSYQPFRFSLLNSTNSVTSYATNQVFTTTENSSCQKQVLLPVCYVSEPGLYSGTAMVVQQPGDLQWQTNCVYNLQNNNTIRCLQKGLGAYCQKVSTGGQWSLQESKLHINVLGLLAIKLVGGGGVTQNKEMIAISKEIWQFALSKGITITAEYWVLVNPQGQLHPLVVRKALRLVTWKVLGRIWSQKKFRKELQNL